jgi:hypothetical protein
MTTMKKAEKNGQITSSNGHAWINYIQKAEKLTLENYLMWLRKAHGPHHGPKDIGYLDFMVIVQETIVHGVPWYLDTSDVHGYPGVSC